MSENINSPKNDKIKEGFLQWFLETYQEGGEFLNLDNFENKIGEFKGLTKKFDFDVHRFDSLFYPAQKNGFIFVMDNDLYFSCGKNWGGWGTSDVTDFCFIFKTKAALLPKLIQDWKFEYEPLEVLAKINKWDIAYQKCDNELLAFVEQETSEAKKFLGFGVSKVIGWHFMVAYDELPPNILAIAQNRKIFKTVEAKELNLKSKKPVL